MNGGYCKMSVDVELRSGGYQEFQIKQAPLMYFCNQIQHELETGDSSKTLLWSQRFITDFNKA